VRPVAGAARQGEGLGGPLNVSDRVSACDRGVGQWLSLSYLAGGRRGLMGDRPPVGPRGGVT